MKSEIYDFLKGMVRTRLGKNVWARYLWLLGQYNHMNDLGYFRSAYMSMPVDAQDRPIPWFTYPAIAFLGARLCPSMALFEYGSGNSTLWFSGHVSTVTSVEHSREWFEIFSNKLPSNVTLLYCELDRNGFYSRTATESGRKYDVIVIDGRDRVNCALNCLSALNDGGIIIWDNSDRLHYGPGFEFLKQSSFRNLDFWGSDPCSGTGYCTSIFYRSDNCLGI
jgi:hypothetical protein